MFLTTNRLNDEESNSFEGSGENFETPIFIKERKEKKLIDILPYKVWNLYPDFLKINCTEPSTSLHKIM